MLRSTLLHLLFIFAATLAFSQKIEKPIQKGNKLIGLSGSYTRSITGLSSSSLSVSPSAGYFVISSLALGIGIPLQLSNAKIGGGKDTRYQAGLGPFAKYYFQNGILLGTYTNFQLTGGHYPDGINDSKFTGISFSITPSAGYAFFLNQNVALELAANYEFSKMTYKVTSNVFTGNTQKISDQSFYISLGFQIFLK